MRQGQPLGALLGYRFERGLHEGYPELQARGIFLDRYIPACPRRCGAPTERKG